MNWNRKVTVSPWWLAALLLPAALLGYGAYRQRQTKQQHQQVAARLAEVLAPGYYYAFQAPHTLLVLHVKPNGCDGFYTYASAQCAYRTEFSGAFEPARLLEGIPLPTSERSELTLQIGSGPGITAHDNSAHPCALRAQLKGAGRIHETELAAYRQRRQPPPAEAPAPNILQQLLPLLLRP